MIPLKLEIYYHDDGNNDNNNNNNNNDNNNDNNNNNSAWTRSTGWHLVRNIQPIGKKSKMHLPF